MADVGKIFTYLAYLQDVAIAYLCGKYCDAIAQFIILFIYILNEYLSVFFHYQCMNFKIMMFVYSFMPFMHIFHTYR